MARGRHQPPLLALYLQRHTECFCRLVVAVEGGDQKGVPNNLGGPDKA
jgi:hypothetical protein